MRYFSATVGTDFDNWAPPPFAFCVGVWTSEFEYVMDSDESMYAKRAHLYTVYMLMDRFHYALATRIEWQNVYFGDKFRKTIFAKLDLHLRV